MSKLFRGVLSSLHFFGLAVLLSLAGEAAAQRNLMQEVERPDEEAVILSVELGRTTLSEGILVFHDSSDPEVFLVPLGTIMDVFELQVDVDLANGRAEGWVYREDRLFRMDLAEGVLSLDGETIQLSSSDVERHFDDIYVRIDALEDWLPLQMEVNYRRLTIEVITVEPLPLEERLAAEERRRNIRSERHAFDGPLLPPEDHILTYPLIDTNVSTRFDRRETGTSFRSNYTVQAATGLLGQDFTTAINGGFSDQVLAQEPSIRMTIGKNALDQDLFGIPGMRSYAVGDVAVPRIGLIAGNTPGRGARISSFGPNARSLGNRVTLRGELPAGWEVEIYRGGEILDFQTEPDADGRYEFSDLLVRRGVNVFRLVFFGPQGQQREEVERFFFDGGRTKPGETNFEVGFNQARRDLIDLRDSPSSLADEGAFRGTAFVEHGFSQRLSGNASITSLVTPHRGSDGRIDSNNGDRQVLLGAGLRGSLFGVLAEFETAFNPSGGAGGGLSLNTAFDGVRLNLEHREFRDLDSEISNSQSSAFVRDSEIEISTSPDLPLLGRNPITVNGRRFATEDGIRTYELLGRYSTRFAGLRQSNELRWTFEGERGGTVTATPQPTRGDAVFRIGTSMGRLRLRGEATQRIQPVSGLQNLNFTADWRLSADTGLRAAVRHTPTTDVTTLTGGMNWDEGRFAIGLNADVDSNADLSTLLSLRVSFGFNSRNGRASVHSKRLSNSGAVAPRAFLDIDASGRPDPGEPFLENVAFRGQGLDRGHVTSSDGIAFIPHVRPYQPNILAIDIASLQDPFLAPTNPRQRFFARPGQTTYLDFPVVPTGEIDGTVKIVADGRERPGRGLKLELVDKNGETVRDQIVGFDGYYYFGAVPYGSYTLRVDRDHDMSVPIVLDTENDFAWDTNFTVERE